MLGPDAESRLKDVRNIHIVACGTSYHAGLVARYWLEEQTGLPCQVELRGAYALGVIHQDEPNTLYCARMGSPLVIGEGSEEHFIASDPLALLQVTDQAHYPIAMEGALKLKEISYIHVEAYAAGELKHGPLALVDDAMPVVSVAPSDSLLEKLKSNLQEVRASGGQLINFACERADLVNAGGITHIKLPWLFKTVSPSGINPRTLAGQREY